MNRIARVASVLVSLLVLGFFMLAAAAVLDDDSLDSAQRLWALAGLLALAMFAVVVGAGALHELGREK